MDRTLLFITAFCAAYCLDLILGDPQGWPHPVRILGKIITFLEDAARKICHSPAGLKVAGAVIVVIVAGGSAVAVFPCAVILPVWNVRWVKAVTGKLVLPLP